jgi:hypothetical protein
MGSESISTMPASRDAKILLEGLDGGDGCERLIHTVGVERIVVEDRTK